MKQLLFSAIAPTVTSLFTAETLLVVVNRVVTTTQVATIVAEWEIVLLTFRFQRYWSKQPTLVIVGHVPITVPARHHYRGEDQRRRRRKPLMDLVYGYFIPISRLKPKIFFTDMMMWKDHH